MKTKPRVTKPKAKQPDRPAPVELIDRGRATRCTRGFVSGFTSEGGFPPFIRWHS